MTFDELKSEYEAASLRYGEARDELLDALVEIYALHVAYTSPKAAALGGPGSMPGFGHTFNQLPAMLAHATAAPYEARPLTTEINARVATLVEQLIGNPPAAT
jgi:hypothetical protein